MMADIGLDPLSSGMNLFAGFIGHFVDGARADINAAIQHFLFSTVDTTRPGGAPLTSNPSLQRLNGSVVLATDILLTAVVLFASMRSVFERSLHATYGLKTVVPKVLVAIVLAHGSLLGFQMLVDLNNALCAVAIHLGATVGPDDLPWAPSFSPAAVDHLRLSQDLFHAIVTVGVVVAVIILMLTYVVRMALLNVLIVTAPLAATLGILPDTRGYARTWLRLTLVTLFMQAVQLVVLRVATFVGFGADVGLTQSLYALATLYLVLKVPGALNTASHLETKAKTASHGIERRIGKLIHPTHRVVHRTTS